MVSLIESKIEKANRRIGAVNEILQSLINSKARFKSARKLSEFVADRMKEQGDPINSATLRREGSPYKKLLDNYSYIDKRSSFGMVDPSEETVTNLTLRMQTKRISELEVQLKEKERMLVGKEKEIELLLIKRHSKRNESLAEIAPPKASIYSKYELIEAQETIKEQLRTLESIGQQLDLACDTLNLIMKDSHETYVVKGGQFRDTVNFKKPVMFHIGNLERYFSRHHSEE